MSERAEAEAVTPQELVVGTLKFRLCGHKLQGSFALIQTRGLGKKEIWLLIKRSDGYMQTGYEANAYDCSAVSGRSLSEIAAEPQSCSLIHTGFSPWERLVLPR